jgi:ABC-2 type transport system ATP-binding protein
MPLSPLHTTDPGGDGRLRRLQPGCAASAGNVSAPAVIETDHLTKRFGPARGIEDVTMSVREGEVFGFLGPNGAGKTTTIRTLLDLLRPTSGTARIFGLDAHRDGRAIRARLGNLPGEFSYDPRMTGRELVGLFAALRGMPDQGDARILAERFEADLARPLGELSRGNRQKIGLIQALFHQPDLLILDEPTGGLDPLMQEEFLAVIAEHRARGATVLVSSHDLDEVQRACDRVGIIREGRLVAVEDIDRMRDQAYRNVSVRFAEPPDLGEIAGIDGVDAVQPDGQWVRFRVRGELDPVVKAAARHRVIDIEIARPTLEELFLTYYRGEADR